MTPDELPLLELPDQQAWHDWLAEHHATAPGAWVKLAKKGSGRATVTQAEAVEAALCWGWIDGQVGRVDEAYYRQRFTRRTARSPWSQINVAKATRLIEAGRMQAPGMAAIEAAQADGRWAAAYAPSSRATVPEDLAAAIAANPRAEAFFATISKANRYAFTWRLAQVKRPETRARRIEAFVAMLERGETFH
jgi:uncharacterized protein YdeI (YjbR/CyaY-like superfamily)